MCGRTSTQLHVYIKYRFCSLSYTLSIDQNFVCYLRFDSIHVPPQVQYYLLLPLPSPTEDLAFILLLAMAALFRVSRIFHYLCEWVHCKL